MKDKEQDVFANAAAQMHKGFPVLVKTGVQDRAQLERLYPEGVTAKQFVTSANERVLKYLIAIVGALIGAVGGYGMARLLSAGDGPSFTTIATAVVGGVILSTVFAGIYSAIAAK